MVNADEILGAYDRGEPRPSTSPRPRPKVVADNSVAGPLVLRPARLPDPTTIPPRQWLYGTQLLRGFVTVLVAPGGTGKSVYAMTVAAALACGQSLLGEHIFARVNVAILNLEDPLDELDRRLAAIMMRHKIRTDELEGRLFLHSGEQRSLTMAAMSEDGFTIVHPDEDALIQEIKAHNIGLVIADPFAESHSLEENSNPQMVKAAAAWRRVARETDCAIMLVHHVRKGAVTDIDASRGAKALTDSARVGILLSPMTEEDAKTMLVDEEDRRFLVRLDNAKANLAPRAGRAKWLKLEEVALHNETPDYPHGDRVAAMVSWEAVNIWATTVPADLNKALDSIARGPVAGALYTDNKRGTGERWAGHVLVEMLDIPEDKAALMIKAWVKSKLLVKDTYIDPKQRKERDGVRVDDSKRPTE